jgi:hypothetical protein
MKKNKLLKRTVFSFVILIIAIVGFFALTPYIFRLNPPKVDMSQVSTDRSVTVIDSVGAFYDGSYIKQNEWGLWEVYLEGKPFERGVASGKLERKLLAYQEDAFVKEIRHLVPSDFYLKFLRNFISIFNRKLNKAIPDEFREEIYGISLSCSSKYNNFGTPYERQLNYHAAHDLGHAMQDYMLVGCTSFAAWDAYSEDSSLIVGRNFDFYVGDDFAKNKTVLFCAPDTGYRFVSIAWAGMCGVVSGMNERGLTVTINAAKSAMPLSSATPVSILCREILQYASNIEEARLIAEKCKLFVSESILIGSAADHSAAIIEKSPDRQGFFTAKGNHIVCANHFQSETFAKDAENKENTDNADSYYRQARMEELISENVPINPLKAAQILRNRDGINNQPLELGDERAINQLIGHHSVIFKPEQRQIWVSTSPWQLGVYVCYDLGSVFAKPTIFHTNCDRELNIPADSFVTSPEFAKFLYSRDLKNN